MRTRPTLVRTADPGAYGGPFYARQSVVRLAASLLTYTTVTRSDYCRFLRAYLVRTGWPPDAWKEHYRRLSQQANDYVRRARRRKANKLDGYAGDT